jgi:hypothetical protein
VRNKGGKRILINSGKRDQTDDLACYHLFPGQEFAKHTRSPPEFKLGRVRFQAAIASEHRLALFFITPAPPGIIRNEGLTSDQETGLVRSGGGDGLRGRCAVAPTGLFALATIQTVDHVGRSPEANGTGSELIIGRRLQLRMKASQNDRRVCNS